MKIPTRVLSHHLARSISLSPFQLKDNLLADLKLGYSGAVVVPALIPGKYAPIITVKAYKDAKAQGLVCGFLPGDGPDPFKEGTISAASDSLTPAFEIAKRLAKEDCGPFMVVGPLHVLHRSRIVPGKTEFYQWVEKLRTLSKGFGVKIALEPLNSLEDPNADPFDLVYDLCQQYPDVFGMHFDTGHAHARHVKRDTYKRYAKHIAFLELVNPGRYPLHENHGIDFGWYIAHIDLLRSDCVVGVEPFCREVIEAFDLRKLCPTMVSGPDALEQDARYLRMLGLMSSQI